MKTSDGNQINSSLALENLEVGSNGRSIKQWIKLPTSYTRASNRQARSCYKRKDYNMKIPAKDW